MEQIRARYKFHKSWHCRGGHEPADKIRREHEAHFIESRSGIFGSEHKAREVCIGSEVWLRPTFGSGLLAARQEQEVVGAFHEFRACSVGLLEPLEFIGKLGVDG